MPYERSREYTLKARKIYLTAPGIRLIIYMRAGVSRGGRDGGNGNVERPSRERMGSVGRAGNSSGCARGDTA